MTLIDDEVGRILSTLEELGVAGDTAVIYTTDHGGMVGSHGLADKGPHLYEEELRIPLIVNIPVVTKGARSNAYVYNMDLMPTILEMAGAGVPEPLDALSLMPILRGEKESVRDRAAFVEFHGHQCPYSQRVVQTDEAKYIYNVPEFDELYDLKNDPAEMNNVVGDPEYRPLLARMREMLWDYIKANNDPINRFYRLARLKEKTGSGY